MEAEEQLKSIFKDLDLTPAAATVYLTLLKKGKLSASQIASQTRLNRSHLYKILEELARKNLTFSAVEEKAKKFYPLEPEKLKELLSSKVEELKQKKELAAKLALALKAELSKKEEEPAFSVEVYEGVKEMRRMFESFHAMEKKGECTYSFGTENLIEQLVGSHWWRNFLKKDRKKRVGFKGVWNLHPNAKRVKTKLVETRYIKSKFLPNIEVNIYKDVVRIFLLTKENPKVILIKNREIAAGFKSYFDFLWRKAK